MHPYTELLMHLASNIVREYPNGVSTVDMHLRMAASPLDGHRLSGRQS